MSDLVTRLRATQDDWPAALIALECEAADRMNNAHIWNQLKELHGDKVEMMPEETDWLGMDWMIA